MELTIEQAIANLQLVCDNFFIGKKHEHAAVEQSMLIVRAAVAPKQEESKNIKDTR